MVTGNWDNTITFQYSEDYDRFINRFEESVDIGKITTNEQLERHLEKWLGKNQPRQNQIDLFTQYYNLPFFEVSEDRQYSTFDFKSGASYNKDTKTVVKKDTKTSEWKIVKDTEIALYNFKYGKRYVILDSKTKRILGHYKDIETGYFLAKGKANKKQFK